MYKVNNDIQQFLSNKFMGEEAIDAFFEKTKQRINEEFFPNRGDAKLRLSEAKKAITEFQKMTSNEVKTTDLMLYYVELGTEFTSAYGDIDAPFITAC
ncbi:MAG: DUF6155 family protein [Bacillus sp. (in: Bacteria)]|nr:DUF6155 family protein [Bacillus sp. (in: firmicutes)]